MATNTNPQTPVNPVETDPEGAQAALIQEAYVRLFLAIRPENEPQIKRKRRSHLSAV